jgi:hypothetical protein
MKTLVAAAHAAGPNQNGHDGCHARCSNGGMCPGVATAQWLNGLGDDSDWYLQPGASYAGVTVGTVRGNYIRAHNHIVPLDSTLASLSAQQQRLSAELRVVRKRINELQQATLHPSAR